MAGSSKNPPEPSELQQMAPLYYKFWESPDNWIIRMVQQFEHLDSKSIQLRVSCDVDLDFLRSSFSRDLNSGAPESFLLPLTYLQRKPFVAIDASSPWGGRTCLATRSEGARLSTYVVFGWLQRAGVEVSGSREFIRRESSLRLRANGLDWNTAHSHCIWVDPHALLRYPQQARRQQASRICPLWSVVSGRAAGRMIRLATPRSPAGSSATRSTMPSLRRSRSLKANGDSQSFASTSPRRTSYSC